MGEGRRGPSLGEREDRTVRNRVIPSTQSQHTSERTHTTPSRAKKEKSTPPRAPTASEYERRGPRSLQQFGFGGGGCSSLSSILRVKQQEYQDKVQMMQIREENLRNKQVAASGRRRNLQGTDIGSDVLQAYNDAWATMAATLYGGREMVAGR